MSAEHPMVECVMCGFKAHVIAKHIHKKHKLSPVEYMEKYPGKSWISDYGRKIKMDLIAQQPRPSKKIMLNDFFGYEVAPQTELVKVYEEPHERTPELNEDYKLPETVAMEFMTIINKDSRNNIYIAGPTGAGKTEFVRVMAARSNAALWELNGHAHMTPAHAFGSWRVRGGETVFEHGTVSLWLKHGGWLLINEYDTFDPAMVNSLKSIFEEPRRVRLTDNGDEIILGHPDCRAIVTCNTWARGDESGMFVNTEVQSIADLRRFHAFLVLDYLEEDAEVEMLQAMFEEVPSKYIEGFVKVANETRAAFKANQLRRVLSTAEVINWTENYHLFDNPWYAARVSFLNGYEDEARVTVQELINGVFGQEDKQTLEDGSAADRMAAKEDE